MNELKSKFSENYKNILSDQKRGKPQPAIQKPYPEEAKLISLPNEFNFQDTSVIEALKNRKTRRKFTGEPLSLEELAFLLWATQGIRGDNPLFRTVPSGGARHPLETYLAIQRVNELKPGLYRYLPIEHKLYCIKTDSAIVEKVKLFIPSSNPVSFGLETFAVNFIWTAIPYRSEWRYPGMETKLVAQDSGHICQNLYLAAEAISAGVCAVDAYIQDSADRVLNVDGETEFTVYMAIVGKL